MDLKQMTNALQPPPSTATNKDVTAAIRKRLGSPLHNCTPVGPPVKTGIHALDAASNEKAAVHNGSLIDIEGGSATGKTQLLHLVAAKALTNSATVGSTDSKPICCWYDLNDGLDVNFLFELIRQRVPNGDDKKIENILKRLYVYKVSTSSELWSSLVQLNSFLRTSDGMNGSFHYKDKYDSELLSKAGEIPVEIMLTDAVKQILTMKLVVVYVSKCALFEMEKLKVNWPFQNAGIPDIPKDIMPEAWSRIVSHVILLYDIAISNQADKMTTSRGMLCMWYQDVGRRRELKVYAASILKIDSDAVTCDSGQTHVL